jgi:hypothetical protein
MKALTARFFHPFCRALFYGFSRIVAGEKINIYELHGVHCKRFL